MISMDFDRPDRGVMTDRAYMFMLGFYVFLGLLANILVASATYRMPEPSFLMLAIVGLGIPFAGIMVCRVAQDWKIATLGYLMIVIPFGVILGPTLAAFQAASVIQAFVVTMVVSAGMWIVGTIIPPITRNWGAFLLGGLLLLIAGNIAGMIMPLFHLPVVFMSALAWFGAFLFSAFIVWDINRAMQKPKTPENAVQSAVGIYLDIYNLFMQLLEIFGRRND